MKPAYMMSLQEEQRLRQKNAQQKAEKENE
jgi:hypothetical protein